MGGVVRKRELVRSVYYEQDKNKEKIQKFVMEDVFDILIDNLREGILGHDKIFLRGFGTFSPIRMNLSKFVCFSCAEKKFVETIRLSHEKVFKPSPELLRRINVGSKDVFQRYFNDSDST